MRAIIQRVTSASVTINNTLTNSIGKGMLVLLGIEETDTIEDAEWLCGKICRLRIFADESGLMNNNITVVDGELLLVSQFTLFASYKKGNRPSFTRAARPDFAIPLYEQTIRLMQEGTGKTVKTGVFGADMQVGLINDGPVTIIMDTKNKE